METADCGTTSSCAETRRGGVGDRMGDSDEQCVHRSPVEGEDLGSVAPVGGCEFGLDLSEKAPYH